MEEHPRKTDLKRYKDCCWEALYNADIWPMASEQKVKDTNKSEKSPEAVNGDKSQTDNTVDTTTEDVVKIKTELDVKVVKEELSGPKGVWLIN